MQAYLTNIEKVITDNILKAKKSIFISVAWFTNKKIIEELIKIKQLNSSMTIEILVDDNEINKKYFFEVYNSQFFNNGIIIKKLKIRKFNHNKVAIIDKKTIITGSYNYTNNANNNLENIIVDESKEIASFYLRTFLFLTSEEYIDENVKLLINNFDFANKIISTYYPFSKNLLNKIEAKTTLGFCFTHPNGLYDEISYEPGLIFNPKIKYHKKLNKFLERKKNNELSFEDFSSEYDLEFELPINKELITSFKLNEINNFNYQIEREGVKSIDEIDFDSLIELADKNELALKSYYTNKFDKTFSIQRLKDIINSKFDLIIEDYLWINNFAPFLNDKLVEKIYELNCK